MDPKPTPEASTRPSVVAHADYERHVQGEVTLSSRDRPWYGMLMIWHTQHGQVQESVRPATREHQLVLFCSREENGEYQYNGGRWTRYVKRKHDWFIAPAYENDFRWRWRAGAASEGSAAICRIHLSPDLLEEAAYECGGYSARPFALLHRMNITDPLMTGLAYELRRELLDHSQQGVTYGATAARMLAVHLLRNYCDRREGIPADRGKLTERARRRLVDYVQENMRQPISLDQMAEVACLSKYHFARTFKNTFGRTPHQFLIDARLSEARQLLRSTDAPVARIAASVGFQSASSLSRTFCQRVGVSPTAYRRVFRTAV